MKKAMAQEINSNSEVEIVLEKTLEDLTLFLEPGKGKSTLYDEILSMVERSLIKIALRRSSQVKLNAAAFLGINRNTLHKKMGKLGIACKE